MVASSLEFVLELSVKDSPGQIVLPLKTKVVLLAYLRDWERGGWVDVDCEYGNGLFS